MANFQIGSFFINGNLNAETYGNFLENDLPRLLEEANVTQEEINHMWFAQDGAPPHRPQANIQKIQNIFGDRIIALGANVTWPPRSPDFNLLDFCIWGHVKEFVYAVEIQTIDQLRQRILDAFATITPEMLTNAGRSFIRRARCCIDQQGGHFEQLL